MLYDNLDAFQEWLCTFERVNDVEFIKTTRNLNRHSTVTYYR